MTTTSRLLGLAGAALCLATITSSRSAQAEERDRCSEVAKAGHSLITVTSDANCKLTINGESKGTLAANQARDVETGGGKKVFECASSEFPGAVTQDTLSSGGGCGTVTFEVAQTWRRFSAQKNGSVADTDSGLSWMPSDNGADIDWTGAKKYCADKGGRLPTEKEMRELHAGEALRTPCGGYPCKMSNLFHLSARFLWTSSLYEGDQAIIIGMAGQRPAVQSVKLTVTKDARALCVAAAN